MKTLAALATWSLAAAGLLLPAAARAQAPAVPRFVDETDVAGVQSRFDGDWEYTVGGGVAALDCDGSGAPSLFIAGGANRSRFYRNKSPRGGALKFVQERAGLELTSTLGAYPVDLDGDGLLDLVVLRVGETLLMSAPTNAGSSAAATSGRPPSRRPGWAAMRAPRSPSAPTSTAPARTSPGATAPTTPCSARRAAKRSASKPPCR